MKSSIPLRSSRVVSQPKTEVQMEENTKDSCTTLVGGTWLKAGSTVSEMQVVEEAGDSQKIRRLLLNSAHFVI